MTTAFPSQASKVIDALVAKITEKKWDKDLTTLYKWPLGAQLKSLEKSCTDMPEGCMKWLNNLVESLKPEVEEPTFDMTLVLRKNMPVTLEIGKADEIGELSEINKIKLWIVRDWGGIQRGEEASLLVCINNAKAEHDANEASGNNGFTFERIASWSKYLAFRFPQRYAIYDARVIYSLNWLLLESQKNDDNEKVKYFPFLDGQNSVMGLLNYNIHLLLAHHGKDALLKFLRADINSRNEKLGKKSRLRSSLEKGLFIRKQEAFSEYCELLKILAKRIYPNDEYGLTKIEMILFSIADKAIAEEVMNSLTGKSIESSSKS